MPAEEYQRVWDSYVAEKLEKARQEAEQKKQIELARQHRDELLSSGIIPVEELDDCLLKELIEQNKDFSILHLLDDDAARTVIRIHKELKKQNKELRGLSNGEILENDPSYTELGARHIRQPSFSPLYSPCLYFVLSVNENKTVIVSAKDFRGEIFVNSAEELEREVNGGREIIVFGEMLKNQLIAKCLEQKSPLQTAYPLLIVNPLPMLFLSKFAKSFKSQTPQISSSIDQETSNRASSQCTINDKAALLKALRNLNISMVWIYAFYEINIENEK